METLKQLLYYDGRQKYVMKIMEELSELQVSLMHYEQGRSSYSDVIIELSDVYVQLEKIIVLLIEDGRKNVKLDIDKNKQRVMNYLEGLVNGELPAILQSNIS